MTIPVFLICSALHAQTPKHQLEAGLGASFKVGGIKTLLKQKQDLELEGTMVRVFAYEHRLHESFSLGLGVTHQSFEGSYVYSVDEPGEATDSVVFDYVRRAIVLEPKFYYPIKSEHVEIYSSLRLGIKQEKLDALATNNTLNELAKLADLLSVNPLNLSFTPIGINYLPLKNFGFGIAGNIGPTYFTKASIFIRF